MIACKLPTALAGIVLAAAMCLGDLPLVQADPLTPPTPTEIAYLDHLHRVLPGSGDPAAFKSDGELLDKGRYVCYMRDANELVGYEATLVSAIVAQLAFIYLCPK